MDFYKKYGLVTPLEKSLAHVALQRVRGDLSKVEAVNRLKLIAASYPPDSEDYAAVLRMIDIVNGELNKTPG